jgi:O-antigen/teichoic acid export membrane protein
VTGHGRDIFWAYALSAARVASWIVVYGSLYRRIGAEAAALLALVRWTLGLLNYASAGLAPAILHHAAKHEGSGFRVQGSVEDRRRSGDSHFPIGNPRQIYQTGITLSWIGFCIGFLALAAWTLTQGRARGVATLVGLFGTGMLIDLAADAWGAVIQSKGPIRRDYQSQTALELLWAVLATTGIFLAAHLPFSWQTAIGGAYLLAALGSASARALFAYRILHTLPASPSGADPIPRRPLWGRVLHLDPAITRSLLTFGGLVVLAQIADYLYAPTDFLLIRWLIDLKTVAVYAPAVQMDAGIWLLVSGLSTALLPMSATAFGKRDFRQLRRYYLQGTAITFVLLLVVCVLGWVAAPGLFRLWLGDKMKETQKILPYVLIPTVVGGSAMVGRSILLAIGKVRAFTIAVLIAGVSNVILSYCFVRYFDLGLKGIVLGTIVAAVARCALWTPWYVLRNLRLEEGGHSPLL